MKPTAAVNGAMTSGNNLKHSNACMLYNQGSNSDLLAC